MSGSALPDTAAQAAQTASSSTNDPAPVTAGPIGTAPGTTAVVSSGTTGGTGSAATSVAGQAAAAADTTTEAATDAAPAAPNTISPASPAVQAVTKAGGDATGGVTRTVDHVTTSVAQTGCAAVEATCPATAAVSRAADVATGALAQAGDTARSTGEAAAAAVTGVVGASTGSDAPPTNTVGDAVGAATAVVVGTVRRAGTTTSQPAQAFTVTAAPIETAVAVRHPDGTANGAGSQATDAGSATAVVQPPTPPTGGTAAAPTFPTSMYPPAATPVQTASSASAADTAPSVSQGTTAPGAQLPPARPSLPHVSLPSHLGGNPSPTPALTGSGPRVTTLGDGSVPALQHVTQVSKSTPRQGSQTPLPSLPEPSTWFGAAAASGGGTTAPLLAALVLLLTLAMPRLGGRLRQGVEPRRMTPFLSPIERPG